jgi:hypothetical protein
LSRVLHKEQVKKFPRTIWNMIFHCHFYKSLPLFPILRQTNGPSCFCKVILLLSSHVCLGLPIGFFKFFSQTCSSMSLLCYACHMPLYPHWFELHSNIWQVVQTRKLVIMQFSPACIFLFFCLSLRCILQHQILKTLSLCSFSDVTDQFFFIKKHGNLKFRGSKLSPYLTCL